MRLGPEPAHLPEDEVLSDDGLYCVVTPDVPVQALTSKVLDVLNVDH